MNKSLSKFIDLFWITFLISILLYVFFDIKNIFSTLKDVQKEKIIYTLKMETPIIAPLMNFGFEESLEEELEHLRKINKEIKFIKLNNIIIGKKDENLKIITFPILYKEKVIGMIEVGYSDEYLISSFSKKYFARFILYFLLVFVISSIFLIFIRNRVKSLNLLAKKVEKLNFKKQSSLPLIDDYYEIKNITTAINKLLMQVNLFYLNQKKLIKKIMIYKKELETAQKIAEIFTWQYDCINKKLISNNFGIFKNKFGIKNIEEFLSKIENKEQILNKLEELCANKNDSLSEKIILNLNNTKYHFKIEAKLLRPKNIVIGICANITQDIQRQEKISFLAYHDPLTGLVNRTFLKEELEILASIANRNNNKIALIFIDLDNFKFINDTFGHEVGDKLLLEIANRLKKSIRKSDIASRIGGDEFIIVLNNIHSKTEVKKKINSIMKELTKPIIIDNNKLEVTFSAGIAIYPDDAKNIVELFQFSDIAMYEAKKEGKNRYKFITISIKEKVKEFYSILEDLKKGLKNNELILYFQPKVDIVNYRVDGVEALIRWNHPKRGILKPSDFIEIAEKGGIIHHIDSYVLENGIKTLKRWSKNKNLKDLSIALNISANKFLEPYFVEELEKLIKKYRVDPKKLQLEITETVSVQNFEYTVKVLNKIKSLGIKIALDDFGTGYSSLNYLKKIPFDILKIDQTFIRDLLNDKDDLVITKMIVEISKILNKENVAEGVENEKILKIVRDLGVRLVQGFHFSKPITEEELIKFVVDFEKKG